MFLLSQIETEQVK